jgi:DNA-binding transcriptional ArsR family regulator
MTEMLPETVELADPRAMRALAHPVRLALLELVHSEGSANATEAAAATGESPQACSYHLRTLGRWGFLRRIVTDDGRETRWARTARGFRFTHESEAPDAQAAASLLNSSVMKRDERALSAYLERERELPREWREAAEFVSGSVYVTPEELREIDAEVHELVRRYQRDKADRPEGSRRVRFIFRAFPYVHQRGRRSA